MILLAIWVRFGTYLHRRLFALKGRVPPADLAQKPMAKFAQLEPGLKHAGFQRALWITVVNTAT